MNCSNVNENNGKKIILSFPSKVIDNTQFSNLIMVDKLFEDNVYTESKLKQAKRLLKLPKKLDCVYVYILLQFINSPYNHFIAEDFITPKILSAKLLKDLTDISYLHYDSEDQSYTLSSSIRDNLIKTGSFKKDDKNNNISSVSRLNISNSYLLNYTKITPVNLIYDNELNKQLNRIKESLTDNNLKNIQKRILEENQHCSICISFYGPSGSGKTEKVLQLARELKRDIYNYKIADSESKYCGEKQFIIGNMFKDFSEIRQKYIENNIAEPILLLNEADALFAKRHSDDDDHNITANRENNGLQAELLDHIENFDGILIITTNKASNFDEAMERRFLFKIKFDNPTKEIQKIIWKDKFPELSDSDINIITEKYNFTGGNINNIKKKQHIDYILNGNKVSLESILDNCKTEKIEEEIKREIGF